MKTIFNVLDKIIFPALLILSVLVNYHLAVDVKNLENNNKKMLTNIEDLKTKLEKSSVVDAKQGNK